MSDKPIQSKSAIMTEGETASLLRVKRFTLRKWRREGCGPPFVRCGGRLIRYINNDIVLWVEQNRYTSNADELSAKSKR